MSDEKSALIAAVTEKNTDAVKKLVVKGPDNYGMYYISWDSAGGVIPEAAQGKYTSYKEAEFVCDKYNKER